MNKWKKCKKKIKLWKGGLPTDTKYSEHLNVNNLKS